MRAARRLSPARNEYLFDESRKAAVCEGSFAITADTYGYLEEFLRVPFFTVHMCVNKTLEMIGAAVNVS